MKLPKNFHKYARQDNKIIIWFFVVMLFKQLLWISYIPIWHFPDEQAHFGEVQNYAEGNPINPASSNNTAREIDESEILLSTKRDSLGNNLYIYHPEFNIPYSDSKMGIYENQIKNFPLSWRKELVTNEATAYPPLYYQLAALFYRSVYSQNILWRVFVTRLVNILLFGILAYVTFKTAKLLFPQHPLLQLNLALLVGFQPMLSYVFGGVNSDNLFNVLFALAIYVNLLILSRGWELSTIGLSLAVIALCDLTKPQGKLVLLFFLFPLVVLLLQRRKIGGPLLLVIVAATWAFRDPIGGILNQKQFIPEIPVFAVIPGLSFKSYLAFWIGTLKHAYHETIPWYWGVFRWLSLTLPRLIQRSLNWLMVLAGWGLIIYFVKKIRSQTRSINSVLFLFLIYASFIYAAALITFDYLFTSFHGFSLGLQGRYYFPTILPHLALILLGLHALFARTPYYSKLMKLVGLGIVLLHSYTWIFVTSSYFGNILTAEFFLKASQYKPEFLKSPILEILLLICGVSLAKFLWHYLRERYFYVEKY